MTSFVAYKNFASASVITADTAYPTLPASMMLSDHIAQKWRSQTVPTGFVVALDETKDIDVVALFGCNGTEDVTFRVRIGDDPAFATSNYDSGVMDVSTGFYCVENGQFVQILDAPVSGRYVRLDIEDANLAYFQCGRLFVSEGVRPGINFTYGASIGFGTLSRRSQSRGGQIFTDVGEDFPIVTVSFPALSDDEANGFVAEMDRLNSTKKRRSALSRR